MSEVLPVWESEHEIRSFDVDPNCMARLPVFCRFMQEAAYNHAEHLGVGHTHLSPQGITWVLARMRLEVERLPRWGETVHVRTWPSGRDRLFYYRDFEITAEGGELVLRASTAWFVIDYAKRERVIPDWWSTAEYPFSPKVLDAKLSRLKAGVCSEGAALVVNHGDLDQNGHVSNIRYIEWMLNNLPLEFHQNHALQALEVNYLAEAVYGHAIEVCEHPAAGGGIDHAIRAEGADLCRARSVWTTRNQPGKDA